MALGLRSAMVLPMHRPFPNQWLAIWKPPLRSICFNISLTSAEDPKIRDLALDTLFFMAPSPAMRGIATAAAFLTASSLVSPCARILMSSTKVRSTACLGNPRFQIL